MLAWLGVLNALRLLPPSPWFGVAAIFVALALSTVGLLASTLHLGHPERAWRSISQWRTSWLSREGVMALLTYPPALGFAAAWWFSGAGTGVTAVLGLLAAACSLATVACQAMIYATLKPIRQWHHRLVPPNLPAAGAVHRRRVARRSGGVGRRRGARLVAAIGVVFAVAAGVVKLAYWRHIDAAPPFATIESATGLGSLGKVRMLESPHTEENYLLREMGYVDCPQARVAVAARSPWRSASSRRSCCCWWRACWPDRRGVLLALAAVAAVLGVYVERWLFFAEATHTVTLYYGRRDERAT